MNLQEQKEIYIELGSVLEIGARFGQLVQRLGA